MKRLTPICVRWNDTHSDSSWQTKEEIDKIVAQGDKDLACETMGYFWAMNKYALTMFCTRSLDNSMYSDRVRIPRKAVITIQPIKLSPLEGG